MPQKIPHTVRDLVPEILNPLLQDTSLLNGAEILSAESSPIGASFASNAYKVTIETDSVAKATSGLVAKLPSVHEATRDLNFGDEGAYRLEALFYNNFAVKSGLPIPDIYFCEYRNNPDEFCILMEDLTNWDTGSINEGATREQAELVVSNLAGLHARFWNDQSLKVHKSLWPGEEQHYAPYPLGLAIAEELGDSLFPEGVLQIAGHYEPHRKTVFTNRYDAPFTLTHGDSHLQNMMFQRGSGQTTEIKMLDYGRLIVGTAAVDLAYFIELSFQVEDRRAWEKELLEFYYEQLVSHGVTDYSFDQLITNYRLGLFQPLMPVLAVMSRYGPEEALTIGDGMLKTAVDRLVALVDWNCDEVIPK